MCFPQICQRLVLLCGRSCSVDSHVPQAPFVQASKPGYAQVTYNFEYLC